MFERLGPDGAADVVDQDVQPAETLDGLGDHALALGEAFQVGGEGQHIAGLAQLVEQFMDQLGAVHRDQLRALFHQPFGDTAADALGGAGDQGDLVFESLSHGVSPA
ncbi:hypothetical protein D3C76_1355550 [compost metagenome]